MAPAQPSSSREADHAEPRVDAGSAHRREQFCSLSFKLQPRVLMRAIPGHSIDALDEIEDRRWRMSFFLKDGGDDLFGLAFRETPLAEEILSLVGVACDDGSPRRLDSIQERSEERRVGKECGRTGRSR